MKFRALNINYQFEASVRYESLNPTQPSILIQEGSYEQAIITENAGKEEQAVGKSKENHISPENHDTTSIDSTCQHALQRVQVDELATANHGSPIQESGSFAVSPVPTNLMQKAPNAAQVNLSWLVCLFVLNLQAASTKRLTTKSWWHDTLSRGPTIKRSDVLVNLFQGRMNPANKASIDQPRFSVVPNFRKNNSKEKQDVDTQTGAIALGSKTTALDSEARQCMLQAIQLVMLLVQQKQTLDERGNHYKSLTEDVEGEKERSEQADQKLKKGVCRLQPCVKRKREDASCTFASSYEKKKCQVSLGMATDSSCENQSLYNGNFGTMAIESNGPIVRKEDGIHYQHLREQGSLSVSRKEDRCPPLRNDVLPEKKEPPISRKLQKEMKREERRIEKRKRKEKRSKQTTQDANSPREVKSPKRTKITEVNSTIPRIVQPQVAVLGRFNASHANNELDHARNILNNRASESRKLFAETKLQDECRFQETSASKLQEQYRPGLATQRPKTLLYPVQNKNHFMATLKSQHTRDLYQQTNEAERQIQGISSQQENKQSYKHNQPSESFLKIKTTGRPHSFAQKRNSVEARVLHDPVEVNGRSSPMITDSFQDQIELPQKQEEYEGRNSIDLQDFGQQTTGEESFQPTHSNQLDSNQHHYFEEQNSKECMQAPVKILCSEAFLESRGETVAQLASGSWVHSWNDKSPKMLPKESLQRKIMCVDTPLLDTCGVDLEASNRCGILVISAAQLENSDEAKTIVLHLAKLAAIGRYSYIQVLLCCDSEITSSITKHFIKIQFAASTSNRTSTTNVSCKTTTTTNLSASLAHTILSLPNILDSSTNLEYVQEGLVSDRVHFLISLLPVLSVSGAIQCLCLAKSLLSSDCPYFEILLKNQRLRQQMMLHAISNETGQELNPAALVQLSHVLRVVVGNGGHPPQN